MFLDIGQGDLVRLVQLHRFQGGAASLLPSLLAATRAGLPPADDELTNTKKRHGLRHGATSSSARHMEKPHMEKPHSCRV